MSMWTIQPLTVEERKYAYKQSQQLSLQSGLIGYLRAELDYNGSAFLSHWEGFDDRLKTDQFKEEFDEVLNDLRSDDCGLLKNRRGMAEWGHQNPDSSFKGNFATEYGFRVDTEKYAYLMRCIPQQGDYNLYCYCFVRDRLNRQIEHAKEDIRFIDSSYKELFRIPDGGSIIITYPDGLKRESPCRYVDETHVEVGTSLYHICEFAERMEQIGCTYAPKEVYLPPKCFSTMPSSGELIEIDRYQKGYSPKTTPFTPEDSRAFADRWNKSHGVSKAQEAAMVAGSMFGWNTPAAQPKNYDENGKAIKPKDRER